MKFCKDCKWCNVPEDGDYAWARCGHEKSFSSDLISGEPKALHCSVMRNPLALCKEEGLLFEPKKVA